MWGREREKANTDRGQLLKQPGRECAAWSASGSELAISSSSPDDGPPDFRLAGCSVAAGNSEKASRWEILLKCDVAYARFPTWTLRWGLSPLNQVTPKWPSALPSQQLDRSPSAPWSALGCEPKSSRCRSGARWRSFLRRGLSTLWTLSRRVQQLGNRHWEARRPRPASDTVPDLSWAASRHSGGKEDIRDPIADRFKRPASRVTGTKGLDFGPRLMPHQGRVSADIGPSQRRQILHEHPQTGPPSKGSR